MLDFYPTAHILHAIKSVLRKRNSLRVLKLTSIEEFCAKNDFVLKELIASGECTIYHKCYYPEMKVKPGPVMPVPDVFLATLEKVTLFPGYSYIQANDSLLIPNYTFQTKNNYKWTNHLLRTISRNGVGDVFTTKEPRNLEKGIFCGDGAADNYYHFLIEILPRIQLVMRFNIAEDSPLIINSCIKNIPSLLEALNVIVNGKRQIIWCDTGEVLNVKSLKYISSVTWTPMNISSGYILRDEDFVISKYAICALRDEVQSKIVPKKSKLLYIARYKTARQRLSNDRQLAELCESYGFEVIHPQELSFSDQVAYFMGADYIFSCGGGACVNAIFCQPDSRVFIFAPRTHQSRLWATLLENLGIHMSAVETEVIDKALFEAGDIFWTDPKFVERIIKNEIYMKDKE